MNLRKIHAERQADINHTVELIDVTERPEMLRILSKVDPHDDLGFHDHHRIDPPALRDYLAGDRDPVSVYGRTWMICRQILDAAKSSV